MTIEERVEFLHQSIESHDSQIGALTGQIRELKESIATLARVTNDDATGIRTLARIAEGHWQRIAGWASNSLQNADVTESKDV